jgi:hypothetical protein
MLPRAAAFAFACAISANSAAYCLTYTCDMKKEHCLTDPDTGCNIGGSKLFWASSIVSFDVQKDGSKRQDISATQLDAVVNSAFQRWVDVVCEDGNHPGIQLSNFGLVTCAKPEYNTDQPNQNVITFHDSEWPYENTADTLALTTVFFKPDTGEIYDANIEINSYQPDLDEPPRFVLSAGQANGNQDDLNAVLTHEIGHFLGLSHSTQGDATMYQAYQPGMTTLEDDDVAAICESLPFARDTADPGTPPGVPRHGFSRECGEPQSGCCSSTIGGNAPSNGPLALWAFGLGLAAWGGRGRAKRWARRKRSVRALPH